jgi:hypothetical protein
LFSSEYIYFLFFVFSSFLRGDPKIGKNKGDERELVGALSLFFFFLEGETMKEKEIRMSVVSF